MTAAAKCILCPALLEANTKPEHIWLKSLGGRKTSRSLLCDTCNNEFGGGPDKALAESVEFVRNLMNFRDGKRSEPPTIRGRKFEGAKIALKPGGVPVLDGGRPFIISPQPDGNAKVELRVNDAAHLQRLLPDLAAALSTDEDTVRKILQSADIRHVSQRIGTQNYHLSLGGPEAMRSMIKTCLLLWADRYGSQEIEKPCYEYAKRFARHGGDDPVGRITNLVTTPLKNVEKIITHFGEHFNLACVASNAQGQVIGYFRLYNICAWRFVLAQDGHPFGIAGIVSNPADPAQWQYIDTTELVDFDTISPVNASWDAETARISLGRMLQTYQNEGSITELHRICDRASEKMGLSPDTPMTVEQIERYVREVSGRLASWMLGAPYEDVLTPDEIEKLLSTTDRKS